MYSWNELVGLVLLGLVPNTDSDIVNAVLATTVLLPKGIRNTCPLTVQAGDDEIFPEI